MMHKYGDEKQYNEKSISTFKAEGNDIEIIIVVDKLLVGFDAPRKHGALPMSFIERA